MLEGSSVPRSTKGRAIFTDSTNLQRYAARRDGPLGVRLFATSLALLLALLLLPAGTAAAAEEDSEALRAELAAAQQEVETLKAQLDRVQGDLAKQLEEIFAGAAWKSDPEVLVLRGKLEAARREIDAREARIQEAEERVKGALARLAKANKEIESLTERAVTASDAQEARLVESRKEIDRLKGLLAESEGARAIATVQLEEAKARQDVWAGRVVTANKAAQVSAASVGGLRGEIAAREEAIEDLKSKIAEGEEAKSVLADQLAEAKARQDVWAGRLVGANRSAQIAAAQGESLRGELEQRDSTIESLKALTAESEATRASLVDELAEAEWRQDVWAGRLEAADTSATEAAAEGQELREALAARETELAAVQTKLGVAEATLAKSSGLRDELTQAESRVEGLEGELKSLKEQRAMLQAELETADREIAKRIEQVFAAATGDTSPELVALRQEVETKDKQISSLEASGQSFNAELSKLKQQLSVATEEAKGLKAALAEAETVRREALSRAENRQGKQQQELQTATAQAKSATAELASLRSESAASKRRIEALTASIRAAEKEKSEKDQKLAALQSNLERLRDAHQRSLVVRERLGKELSLALGRAENPAPVRAAAQGSTGEAEQLREELDRSKSELTRITGELEAAQAEIKKTRSEIAQRIEKLIMAAAAEPGDSDVRVLQEKLEAAQREITRLNAALDRQKAEGAQSSNN